MLIGLEYQAAKTTVVDTIANISTADCIDFPEMVSGVNVSNVTIMAMYTSTATSLAEVFKNASTTIQEHVAIITINNSFIIGGRVYTTPFDSALYNKITVNNHIIPPLGYSVGIQN